MWGQQLNWVLFLSWSFLISNSLSRSSFPSWSFIHCFIPSRAQIEKLHSCRWFKNCKSNSDGFKRNDYIAKTKLKSWWQGKTLVFRTLSPELFPTFCLALPTTFWKSIFLVWMSFGNKLFSDPKNIFWLENVSKWTRCLIKSKVLQEHFVYLSFFLYFTYSVKISRKSFRKKLVFFYGLSISGKFFFSFAVKLELLAQITWSWRVALYRHNLAKGNFK